MKLFHSYYRLLSNFSIFTYRGIRSVKNKTINYFNKPIIILIYHRVADLEFDPEFLAVEIVNFRQQIEFLKSNFSIITLNDDWNNCERPAVVITFDDGYVDNYLNALPVLEEMDVPATFFISTGYIEASDVFWWHYLEDILREDVKLPSSFALRFQHIYKVWETGSLMEREKFYCSFGSLLRQVGPFCRKDLINQFLRWSEGPHTSLDTHRSMTSKEVQALAASSVVTLGAHTVTHSALSVLKDEDQRYEIFNSKNQLEKISGQKVHLFSYPFGMKRHYNQKSIALCQEAGFLRAAANFSGQVHDWTDPYQLPRHLVRNWDIDTFRRQIGQFWAR